MKKILGLFGLILTLATMIVAPVQDAYAAVAKTSPPMMQMAGGAPCMPKDCAKMPNCPMVLPCLSVNVAIADFSPKPVFLPVIRFVRFAFVTQPALPSVESGGLRRPPKI